MTCEPWLIWTWLGLNIVVLAFATLGYALTLRSERRIDRIRDEALAAMRAMLDRHAQREAR